MDNGHAFDEVLFYGSEFLLLQFELMLFAVTICFSECFLTAIVVVGLTYKVIVIGGSSTQITVGSSLSIQQILQIVVASSTKYNLARKTLIDNRFLI